MFHIIKGLNKQTSLLDQINPRIRRSILILFYLKTYLKGTMIISNRKSKNSKYKLIQFIFEILKKSCDFKKYFLFFLIFKKMYLLSNKVSYIIFERNSTH